MKKIVVRKTGTVRLTARAAYCYGCCCCVIKAL
ncbi:MAG: methanobactin [Acidimicrobiia bacterium]